MMALERITHISPHADRFHTLEAEYTLQIQHALTHNDFRSIRELAANSSPHIESYERSICTRIAECIATHDGTNLVELLAAIVPSTSPSFFEAIAPGLDETQKHNEALQETIISRLSQRLKRGLEPYVRPRAGLQRLGIINPQTLDQSSPLADDLTAQHDLFISLSVDTQHPTKSYEYYPGHLTKLPPEKVIQDIHSFIQEYAWSRPLQSNFKEMVYFGTELYNFVREIAFSTPTPSNDYKQYAEQFARYRDRLVQNRFITFSQMNAIARAEIQHFLSINMDDPGQFLVPWITRERLATLKHHTIITPDEANAALRILRQSEQDNNIRKAQTELCSLFRPIPISLAY